MINFYYMVLLVPICCLPCLILLLLWTSLYRCSLNLVGLSLMYWYTVNTVDKDMIRLLLLCSISFFTLHTIGKCLCVSGVCLRWVWQAKGRTNLIIGMVGSFFNLLHGNWGLYFIIICNWGHYVFITCNWGH